MSNAPGPRGQIVLVQRRAAHELAQTAIRNVSVEMKCSARALVSTVISHRFELDDVEQLLVIQRDFGTRIHEIIRMYDAGLSFEYIAFLGALRANLEDYPELGNFKNSLRSLHRFTSIFRLSDFDPEDAASEIVNAHLAIRRKLHWIKGLRESMKILEFAAGNSDCELASAVQVIVEDKPLSRKQRRK